MTGEGHESSGQAIVVVAHPDDETLWLEPWLANSRTVVVAFPEHPRTPSITSARARIRASFPYGEMVFLPLHSVDVLGRSDWRRRAPTSFGVQLSGNCPAQIRAGYVDNHRKLCELLAPYISRHSMVVTHNPWGEYGHEEHVQVCRAVLDVGTVYGTSVWAWDGMASDELADTSMRLRRDYYQASVAGLRRITRDVDRVRYEELRDFYRAAGAWTWRAEYEPPRTTDYVELMRDGREVITATPPRLSARAVSILGGHVRHLPRVAKRWAAHGRLREPGPR